MHKRQRLWNVQVGKHIIILPFMSHVRYFRYYDRKENQQNSIMQSKKSYTDKRDYLWNLPNKRPAKLKEKLKELEVVRAAMILLIKSLIFYVLGTNRK